MPKYILTSGAVRREEEISEKLEIDSIFSFADDETQTRWRVRGFVDAKPELKSVKRVKKLKKA